MDLDSHKSAILGVLLAAAKVYSLCALWLNIPEDTFYLRALAIAVSILVLLFVLHYALYMIASDIQEEMTKLSCFDTSVQLFIKLYSGLSTADNFPQETYKLWIYKLHLAVLIVQDSVLLLIGSFMIGLNFTSIVLSCVLIQSADLCCMLIRLIKVFNAPNPSFAYSIF
jgi:hypothetical protein